MTAENDPRLEPFDNGIALLLDHEAEVAGYLATALAGFRTPFRPLTRQQCVWWLVTWADGRRERIEEDYPPWALVNEVLEGFAELEIAPGKWRRFAVRWLEGRAKEAAWSQYGITEDVGAYM